VVADPLVESTVHAGIDSAIGAIRCRP